jgi:hypothetical protein
MSAGPMANKLTYQKQSERGLTSTKPNPALFRNDGPVAGA